MPPKVNGISYQEYLFYLFLVGGQSNNLPPQVNGISHQEYLESYLHFYQPVNQITLIQNKFNQQFSAPYLYFI